MSAPFTGRRIPPVMGYYDYTRQSEIRPGRGIGEPSSGAYDASLI